MRAHRAALLGLAAFLLSPVSAHAREYVVALAASVDVTPPGLAAVSTPDVRDRAIAAAVAGSHGLLLTASLGDDVRRALGAAAGTLAIAPSRGSMPGARLDPDRIVLLAAPDSVAPESVLARLARDPRVDWAEPVLQREATGWISGPDPAAPAAAGPATRLDPFLADGRQWGLDNRATAYAGTAGADVRALAAWRASAGSNDVVLAIADTGIDPDHPELAAHDAHGAPRILRGYNIAERSLDVLDAYGHGTPVAGVMAALTGRGGLADSLGVAGVCGGDGGANLGCRILPFKITVGTAGAASSFSIATAILAATRAGARALNLSFAGGGASALERRALLEAITHGCVAVTASGNRGFTSPTTPQYPAAYAAEGLCVQVGASDSFDRRAAFSSHGPGLDLVAPGLDVWTTFMTYPSAAGAVRNGYVAASGTSFAAPFVTGGVGLLAAARPELRDTDFQHLLRETADDVGEPGRDEPTGFGRLNLAAALHAVRPEVGIWHDELAATEVRVVRRDTLRTAEPGPGGFGAGSLRVWADLLEVTATVALPDSFAGAIRVWPRLAGTSTSRGAFDLPHWTPWAEVARVEPRRFTLRGYLHRPADDGGADALPVPLDQARFGFTVIGVVRRETPPAVAVSPTHVDVRPAPRVTPNPFTTGARVEWTGGGGLAVHDVGGRRVRLLAPRAAWWDGADDRGRALPAGLYWIAPVDGSGRATRALKLR